MERRSGISHRAAAALIVLAGCRDVARAPQTTRTPRTFHLAPDGNDEAAGTRDAPLRTITAAAARMRPGDTALLRGGTYRGDFVIPTSGTDGAPLTFAAAQGERPLLVGPSITPGRDADTLRVLGSHVTIDGLRVTNENDPGQAIWIAGSHVAITRCELFGARGQGVLVSGDENLVEDSDIHHNGAHAAEDHGVYVEGAWNTIRRNAVHDNWAFGIQLYAERGEGPGTLVEDNVVFHNGYGTLGLDATWPTAGIVVAARHPRAIIRRNHLCDNAQYGLYAIDRQPGTVLVDNVACCNRRRDVYLRLPGPDTVERGTRSCGADEACAARCGD